MMGHSISTVSRLTGIPADTLRMWERRYGFPSPQRKKSGVRLYSQADIERLRLIHRALQAGHKPRKIVGKSLKELEEILAGSAPDMSTDQALESPVARASIDALFRFKVDALLSALQRALLDMGVHRFLLEVAEPITVCVRHLLAQGHLAIRHASLLRYTLSAVSHRMLPMYPRAGSHRTLVVVTLPGEADALESELAGLYLAAQGTPPVLLGSMPRKEIVTAVTVLGARALIGLWPIGSDVSQVVPHIHWMLEALPHSVELWVNNSGPERLDVEDHARLRVTRRFRDFDDHLQRIAIQEE
jgi:DNA-binding transcriptional MerR regulator